jgi:hypothetical protein
MHPITRYTLPSAELNGRGRTVGLEQTWQRLQTRSVDRGKGWSTCSSTQPGRKAVARGRKAGHNAARASGEHESRACWPIASWSSRASRAVERTSSRTSHLASFSPLVQSRYAERGRVALRAVAFGILARSSSTLSTPARLSPGALPIRLFDLSTLYLASLPLCRPPRPARSTRSTSFRHGCEPPLARGRLGD